MCATGPPNEVSPRRSAARKTSPADPVTRRARLPERLVRAGERVGGAREDEQQVGEAVQVDRDERVDVVLRRPRRAPRARRADRRSGRRAAPAETAVPPGSTKLFSSGNDSLNASHSSSSRSTMACSTRSLPSTENGTHRSAPTSNNSFWIRRSGSSQLRRAVAREDDAEQRVELVGRAVRGDPRIELRDARAVAERGLPRVAAARVDARQANRLVGGAGHGRQPTRRRLVRRMVRGDHDALDLARALVDLGDLRVAVVALDRELLRVAVAAEHLDRLAGLPAGDRRREQLGLSALDGMRKTLLLEPGGPIREPAGRRDLGRHVGELELDRLEVGDPAAELASLERVGRAPRRRPPARSRPPARRCRCARRRASPSRRRSPVLVVEEPITADERSSKRMSAVDEELSPSFSSSRVTSTSVPSTRKALTPRAPSVEGSVRTNTRNVPAWLPFVIHCFAP